MRECDLDIPIVIRFTLITVLAAKLMEIWLLCSKNLFSDFNLIFDLCASAKSRHGEDEFNLEI